MELSNISDKERESLINLFFNGTVFHQPGNVTRRLLKKEGFRDGPIAIFFSEDFQPYEDEYLLFRDNTVLFFCRTASEYVGDKIFNVVP